MPMKDPWQLRRKARRPETRTFTDEEQDAEFTLTLQKMDTAEAFLAHEVVEELTKRYITGGEGDEPTPFPPVGGQLIEVSRALFLAAASAYVMQVKDPETNLRPYKPEDMTAIAATFGGWGDVMTWMGELNGGSPPNASGALGAPSSEPPSSITAAI